MLTINHYHKAISLEEAYQLNLKKRNVIIGGMLWLKMQRKNVHTAIDLCDLNLDRIEDVGEALHIGAMVTLRTLETDKTLHELTNGAFQKSVEHLVGVQFRNLATVGGSVFSKFGFSDVTTLLLALDAKVKLYHNGVVPLETFLKKPYERDILTHIVIDKKPYHTVFLSQKNSKTDFAVLNCAVTEQEDRYTVVIGARPQRSALITLDKQDDFQTIAEKASTHFVFGDNHLASATYRKHICNVLVLRALEQLAEKE